MGKPEWRARQRSLYRKLLVLYPRSFRDEYAAAMVQIFGDCLRECGPRVWLRALPDVLRTAPTQRIEAIVNRLSAAARIVALALMVLGAAAVGIGLGAGAVPVVAVLVIAIAVSQRRLFASIRGGERAPLRYALLQAWWAPLAGLLGAAMILFAFGTLFEAHNWGGRVFGSTVMFAFGGAMLAGLVRRPFAREAGNALILVATIPTFPLFWLVVPTAVAIVIWVGVLASGFRAEEAVSPAG